MEGFVGQISVGMGKKNARPKEIRRALKEAATKSKEGFCMFWACPAPLIQAQNLPFKRAGTYPEK